MCALSRSANGFLIISAFVESRTFPIENCLIVPIQAVPFKPLHSSIMCCILASMA